MEFAFVSELPVHLHAGGDALLFAGPAGDAQVEGQGLFAGLDLPAYFGHAAGALEAGGGGAHAVVGGSGFPVEFVLPGQACVEFVLFVQGMGVAEAYPEAAAVDAVEVVALLVQITVDGYII